MISSKGRKEEPGSPRISARVKGDLGNRAKEADHEVTQMLIMTCVCSI